MDLVYLPILTIAHFVESLWGGCILFWFWCSFGNKPNLKRHPIRSPLLLLPVAFAASFFLLVRFAPDYLDEPFIPEGTAVDILGLVLVLAGMAIAVWARCVIGRNWSANVTIKRGHELLTTGPYAYVRHPIYSGLFLAVLGSVIVFHKTGGAILFFYCLIGVFIKARIEEKYMIEAFGSAYTNYRRRVKAFVPFVF